MEASAARPVRTLAAGDEISVGFPGAPELNSKRKIQPDGSVSLPTVGDVPAAGSSIPQLRSRLIALYRPHLRNPDAIIALESAAAGIYVSGEVVRPGKVALERPMTALEAVMEAGGFSELANTSKVSVIRNEGGVQRRFELNMKDTLSGYGTRPFYLRPYDVVHVRQSVW
jgi:polysaccharide export outer membrane protein